LNQTATTKKSFIKEYALESIFVLILLLYPLRHIHWGLDLWDTGYSYANFEYMGLEHMDSMWLFSTYLANGVGRFLTMLPGGGTLLGMNLYTGLFVSGLALTGYFFGTRKLEMPKWIVLVGEFAAISLCWCPTAKLYDYLTYVLFLIGVIFLYQGLVRDKGSFLFAAGICLGANVLVRFSNLPEAAMIVAVWAYAFICAGETNRSGSGKAGGRAWLTALRHTLWCMGGYLSALVVLLGYIHIRYGLDAYVAGIGRLFAMTDTATDYKATSMIMGIVGTYVENLYWMLRIFVIIGIGMVVCAVSAYLIKHCKLFIGHAGLCSILKWGSRIVCVGLAVAMLYWLCIMRGFCSFYYYSYDPIRRPGILFMMLAMLIAIIRIFHPRAPKEEKLISGIILLVVLLTSVGSNNEVYPSMNNLFLAAPYTLWQCWRFVTAAKEWEWRKLIISPLAAKCILTAFIGLFLFQVILFGAHFTFVEATGARNVTATVDNNEMLKGIKMSPERAQWMSEITSYVKENNLQGREVILYGYIPSLSYYLQMPPAFNSWSDLASYSLEQMKLAMSEVVSDMNAGGQRPVIILEKSYCGYLQLQEEPLPGVQLTDAEIAELEKDPKWRLVLEKGQLLGEFIQEQEYRQTFVNDKFVIWE